MPKKKKSKKVKKTKKVKIASKKTIVHHTYKTNVFKSNAAKVNIKNVTKQPTEKRLYHLKE